MIPFEAIRYTALSALLVISLFMGLRMILAHDVRREAWRSGIKRFVYLSRPAFRRTTQILGWILFILGLAVAYYTIIDLMD